MLILKFNASASCLDKSLAYAKEGNSSKAKQKTLNNYAVLCRLQRRYDDAIAYLRQMAGISNLSENELFVFYLNMGKIFSAANEMDSAAVYFNRLDMLLPSPNNKEIYKNLYYLRNRERSFCIKCWSKDKNRLFFASNSSMTMKACKTR